MVDDDKSVGAGPGMTMTGTLTDGGPAFPLPGEYLDNDGNAIYPPGMSLRDWFAGQALIGWLAGRAEEPSDFPGPDVLATASYELADAMIAAAEATP